MNNPLDLDAIKARAELVGVQRGAGLASAADVPALVAEVERLRAFVADLAKHGTRFDLNPTVDSRNYPLSYVSYIERIDKSIRDGAAAILAGSQTEGAPLAQSSDT